MYSLSNKKIKKPLVIKMLKIRKKINNQVLKKIYYKKKITWIYFRI